MKKALVVLFALTITASFSACGTTDSASGNVDANETTATGYSQSLEQTSETVSSYETTEASETPLVSETKTVPIAGGKATTAATTKASGTVQKNKVYIGRIEQDSLGTSLPDSKADTVREIVGRYKMDQHSWDNISGYTLVVDGVYYAYDSGSGILTKDDTHADKLSNADRKALNAALGIQETTTNAPKTYSGTTITDSFIIKTVSGTHLTLAKYDRNNGEQKDGLYACDYSNLDGSDQMQFNVGDVVTVRYDQEIAETYPMQLTAREIYIAEWN